MTNLTNFRPMRRTRRCAVVSTVFMSLTIMTAPQAQAQSNDQILQLFPSGGQGCTDTVKLNLTNAGSLHKSDVIVRLVRTLREHSRFQSGF